MKNLVARWRKLNENYEKYCDVCYKFVELNAVCINLIILPRVVGGGKIGQN